ncbi:MAG: hypothetical protein ACREXU_01540, partial [Gammaproteobacteria bacterium]
EVYRGLFTVHVNGGQLTRIREAWQTGTPLGNDRFKEQVEAMMGRAMPASTSTVTPGVLGSAGRRLPAMELQLPQLRRPVAQHHEARRMVDLGIDEDDGADRGVAHRAHVYSHRGRESLGRGRDPSKNAGPAPCSRSERPGAAARRAPLA